MTAPLDDRMESFVKEIAEPLFESQGWMKFLAVMLVLQGVGIALTIVGVLIAWLPIWAGVLLYQSASGVEHAELTGEKARLMRALRKLKLFFIVSGVGTLAGLILGLLAMLGGLSDSGTRL